MWPLVCRDETTSNFQYIYHIAFWILEIPQLCWHQTNNRFKYTDISSELR